MCVCGRPTPEGTAVNMPAKTALSQSQLDVLLKSQSVVEFLHVLDLEMPYAVDDLNLQQFMTFEYDQLKLMDFTDEEIDYILDAIEQIQRQSEKKSANVIRNICSAIKMSVMDKQRSRTRKTGDRFEDMMVDLEAELVRFDPLAEQVGQAEGFTLFSAVITGHQKCVQKFLDSAPAAINRPNRSGWTPLMYSLAQGCSDGTTPLLKRGADPLAENDDGMTALGLGASYGHRSTIRNFLRFFRDRQSPKFAQSICNHQDRRGRTPLHYAAENRQWEACEVLLNFGADPNVRDKRGDSCMLVACKSNNSRTVRALFKNGGDPHIKNKKGVSGYALLSSDKKYLVEENHETDAE